MKIKIEPAITPYLQHKIETILRKELDGIAVVDGGVTMTTGTESEIFVYALDGKTDEDVRMVLSGRPEAPPWKLTT